MNFPLACSASCLSTVWADGDIAFDMDRSDPLRALRVATVRAVWCLQLLSLGYESSIEIRRKEREAAERWDDL
jgi:hypothetical protein